jgi:hypothetical protein
VVVDAAVGTPIEADLDRFVPTWMADGWRPFRRPRYIGRDLTWDEWLAFPDAD